MLSQRKYNIKIGLEIESAKIGNWIRPVEREKVCPSTRLEGMQGELRYNSNVSFNLDIRSKQPHAPGALSPVPTEKGAVKIRSENAKGFAQHREH